MLGKETESLLAGCRARGWLRGEEGGIDRKERKRDEDGGEEDGPTGTRMGTTQGRRALEEAPGEP